MSESGYLHRYFLTHNSENVIHKWHHYLDVYERHFSRFRNKSPTILEIGIWKGGSVEMWKDYFGEGCKIIGLDIDDNCKKFEDLDKGIEIFIGSQDDPNIIESIFQKYPNIDIVIDDGSHINRHMIKTFELLYNRINPNGVYLVEDTHCCYWQSHEGGLKQPNTFIEFVKNKFDELNAVHNIGIESTEFTKNTNYMSLYDSMVVFERRRQSERKSIVTGAMSYAKDTGAWQIV